jgi:hypothetical protein
MNIISCVAAEASNVVNGTENGFADMGPDTYVPKDDDPARSSLFVDERAEMNITKDIQGLEPLLPLGCVTDKSPVAPCKLHLAEHSCGALS